MGSAEARDSSALRAGPVRQAVDYIRTAGRGTHLSPVCTRRVAHKILVTRSVRASE